MEEDGRFWLRRPGAEVEVVRYGPLDVTVIEPPEGSPSGAQRYMAVIPAGVRVAVEGSDHTRAEVTELVARKVAVTEAIKKGPATTFAKTSFDVRSFELPPVADLSDEPVTLLEASQRIYFKPASGVGPDAIDTMLARLTEEEWDSRVNRTPMINYRGEQVMVRYRWTRVDSEDDATTIINVHPTVARENARNIGLDTPADVLVHEFFHGYAQPDRYPEPPPSPAKFWQPAKPGRVFPLRRAKLLEGRPGGHPDVGTEGADPRAPRPSSWLDLGSTLMTDQGRVTMRDVLYTVQLARSWKHDPTSHWFGPPPEDAPHVSPAAQVVPETMDALERVGRNGGTLEEVGSTLGRSLSQAFEPVLLAQPDLMIRVADETASLISQFEANPDRLKGCAMPVANWTTW